MSSPETGMDYSLLVGIGVYLVILVSIGVTAARRMRGLDDFVLGGRRIGPLATAVSERASGESSWFLLGLPGAAYAVGFTEFWSVIGIAVGIFCSWTFIALTTSPRVLERTGARCASSPWRSSYFSIHSTSPRNLSVAENFSTRLSDSTPCGVS